MGCGSSIYEGGPPSGVNTRDPNKQQTPESTERRRYRPRAPTPDDPPPRPAEPEAPPEIVEEQKQKEIRETTNAQNNVIDNRSNKQQPDFIKPELRTGELWTDPAFSKELAVGDLCPQAEWKRPKEIFENPRLFVDGATRFDIGQGSAGTCWFLSILSAIAERPKLLKQVIPEDAYNIEAGPDYTGVFHCRFWRFGEWVDVYIDDFLAVIYGHKLWGARSATCPGEMWVSLMEKAFAKFHGSYSEAWGGWAGAAFVSLTGGVAESVNLKKGHPGRTFRRIRNALQSGAVVTCSVPAGNEGVNGLIGKHAYTMTGTAEIPYRGQMLPMVRIRNPWGERKGEWTGAWSDNAREWKDVSDAVKRQLNVTGQSDGEFWMTMEDFCQYFEDAHLCNSTPDVDKDGDSDGLRYQISFFDEWKGEKAAGCKKKKFNNPKMVFEVPEEGLDEDGRTSVVIQIIQHVQDRHKQDYLYMRADLYKIMDCNETDGQTSLILDERTNNKTYMAALDQCYRYRLEPGRYLVLPTTLDEGKEKIFYARAFSAVQLKLSEGLENATYYVREGEKVITHRGVDYEFNIEKHIHGSWTRGLSAGGQVSNRRTYDTNPQYLITIPDSGAQLVDISLMQPFGRKILALGITIYDTEPGDRYPLNVDQLYSRHGDSRHTIDEKGTFIISTECDGQFLLRPGRHLMVVFTNKPNDESPFALTFLSQEQIEVEMVSRQ